MLQPVDESGHDARTSHAERMTKSNRTPMNVEPVHRNAEMLGRRNHLGGKCFVDFCQVNLVDGQTGTL